MIKSVILVFGRFLILFIVLIFFSCQIKGQVISKINGLSFVASPQKIDYKEVELMTKVNANYAAIMPFGFMQSLSSTEINFDHPRQWWGEKSEGTGETIKMCHEKGMKIMLKPQIWIGNGDFTGFIEMKSDEDWKKLEVNYSQFILNFAKVAEKEKVEIYCIGTELGKFVANQPEYWSKLIKQVRKVYSGKITYAENWDCFHKPSFLKELDYVGVDAYFPLSDEQNPTIEEIRSGWQTHITSMNKCYKETGKPILFTECGYRSVDFAASKPWEYDHKDAGVNEELQVRLTEVMFELWDEEWLAGGFIWKWFPFHEKAGGPKDTQFTPQNKLAEKTISDFFKIK
jgi:hypothetical protein